MHARRVGDHRRGGSRAVVGPLVGGTRQPVGLLRRHIVGRAGDGPGAGRAVVAGLRAVQTGHIDWTGVRGLDRTVDRLEARHRDERTLVLARGDLAVGTIVGQPYVVDHPLESGLALRVVEDEEELGAVLREVSGLTGAGHGRDLDHIGLGVDDRRDIGANAAGVAAGRHFFFGGARGEAAAAEGEQCEGSDGDGQTHVDSRDRKPPAAGSETKDRARLHAGRRSMP